MNQLRDPTRLLGSTNIIQCGEVVMNKDDVTNEDIDDLPIIFLCTLSAETMLNATNLSNRRCSPCTRSTTSEFPPATNLCLRFGCRRPSFDSVLTDDEQNVADFDDSAVDPNLFDTGYTLAGSTGFCVWAGARFMLEAMLTKDSAMVDHVAGMRVLELGAGVGMLGTALAALGGEVLLTDLPTLVNHAIVPNLYRNASSQPIPATAPSKWLNQAVHDNDDNTTHRIGLGWASAVPLDWTKALSNQLSKDTLQQIDIVVASDCIWLASLLHDFLNTLDELFQHGTSKCLLSFRRRECNIGSALFTTSDALIDEIQDERGWKVRLLAWRPLDQVDGGLTDVCLIEISP